ncbi:hypothetical protein DSO57_1018114 [Entomophthora muscae]|uniref:Uncharacterized protein n=1 Tax=Entomophthora muscae TaxID=34485 RepID=A0ACC2SHA1_9FUNG|nr:hypothetical protein DSO57_1018114 [Entomophthora muscae]
MESQTLEELLKRLRHRDVLFDGEAEQLIKECKEKGSSEEQLTNILKDGWVSSPSLINLSRVARQALVPEKTDWNFKYTAFKKILQQRLLKAPDDVYFSDSNPPAFLKNALDSPFFQKILGELSKTSSSNQVLKYARRICLSKGNLENGRNSQAKTSLEKLEAPLLEVANSNKEDISLKLRPFLEKCIANTSNYVVFQTLTNLELLNPFYMKFFSNELKNLAYADSKKHTALKELNLTLHGVTDQQYTHRFHMALSKPAITSDIVIEVIWEACMNGFHPAIINATKDSALIDRMIDYIFISHQPSIHGLNDTKRKAIELLGFLQHREVNVTNMWVTSTVGDLSPLMVLYRAMAGSFKDMVASIDPDTINGMCSLVFAKFVYHYIKQADYYEGYMDPKVTPTLHIILRKISKRFHALRPLVMKCFVKCFESPSVAAQRLSTGKSMMQGIIDHVVYFVRLEEEELVISTMKKHFTLADDYLEYAIKKLLSNIKPPFSHSLVFWLCDWFLHIYGCNRHLVLQSGILKKFLSIVKLPGSMIATSRFPNLNSQIISMIERVDEITKN